MASYTYSVQDDFTSTTNVDLTCLNDEIEASTIPKTLLGISRSEDDVVIDFDVALTAEEEALLDSIVSSHTGACPKTEEQEATADGTLDELGDVQIDSTSLTESTVIGYNPVSGKWVAVENRGLELVAHIFDEDKVGTTSTSWVERLNLTFNIEDEGSYLITWTYEWAHSHASYYFYAIITLDEKFILMEHYEKPRSGGNLYQTSYPASGFKIENLTAGQHALALYFASSHKKKASYIRRCGIAVWRIR